MANANTELTLEQLHDAIEAQIRDAFRDFKLVEFYRDDEDERIPTPACLLEMTEAEPAPALDAGTGQWTAMPRFEARIIMAKRSKGTALEIRKAALALATWLHLRRFPGVPTDPCQIITVEPDEFAPNLDRFTVWRVEWVVPAMFGESAWHNDGTVPGAWYSFAPDIGIGHEDDYKPLRGVTP